LLTRDRLVSWVLLLAAAIVIALCFRIALPFVPPLTWAAVVSVLARPMHLWLERHIESRNLAALLSVVLVAIVILGPVVWMSFEVSQEIADDVKRIQADVKSGAFDAALHKHPRLVNAYNWLNERVDLANAGLDFAKAVQGRVTRFLSGTVQVIVETFISIFMLFFFLRDRREIVGAIHARLPFSDDEIRMLLKSLKNVVRAVVFGRILIAAIQGALGGIMFAVLGIQAALLWAVVMAVLSMIPAVGSVFIWGPAAAWLAVSGHWVKAIVLVIWGSAVVGTIDNILYPLFVGRDVKIHTLLLFIALLGGVLLFGPTGLVLGPVLMETGLTLIEILRERTQAGEPLEQSA
jgi:predicted PurR-regulated permease PerM